VFPLNSTQQRKLTRVLECLTMSLDSGEVRQHVGEGLLDLLEADYFASYIWDQHQRCFRQRVVLNMEPANLDDYEAYFQFHDPITPALQKHTSAVPVRAVMPQRELLKTEFYTDFLRRDGLYYGINLYAYDGRGNIGDLRIWRGRHREDFGDRERAILDYIKPFFVNVMRNLRIHSVSLQQRGDELSPALLARLTPREADVLRAVVQGMSDKLIARHLGISFATVRTYVNRLFAHFGVHSRSELIHRTLN